MLYVLTRSLSSAAILYNCVFVRNELRSAVKCVLVRVWVCGYCNALTWCECIYTVTKTGKEGTKKCLLPCTPLAIIKVLESLKVFLSHSLSLFLSSLSLFISAGGSASLWKALRSLRARTAACALSPSRSLALVLARARSLSLPPSLPLPLPLPLFLSLVCKVLEKIKEWQNTNDK